MKQSLVNSYGVIFNVVTTQELQGYGVIGSPNMHDSWFPGFAWEALICSRCHEHLGWRFSTPITIVPDMFFGLVESSIQYGCVCLLQTWEKRETIETIQESRRYRINGVSKPQSFHNAIVSLYSS